MIYDKYNALYIKKHQIKIADSTGPQPKTILCCSFASPICSFHRKITNERPHRILTNGKAIKKLMLNECDNLFDVN